MLHKSCSFVCRCCCFFSRSRPQHTRAPRRISHTHTHKHTMLWTVLWVGTAIYFVLGLALSIYPPYVQDKAYVLEARTWQ